MHGFQTSRVLVIDDNFDEASAVIRVLAQSGVGVVYHSGESVAPRPIKLDGIRLLFVDMVLSNLGATPENPRECASIAVGVLGDVMNDDSHPIVVVCWTSHADENVLIEQFREAFVAKFPLLHVDGFLVYNKRVLLRDPQNLIKLLADVNDAQARFSPLTLLFQWEQNVHEAANRTTSQLSRLISEGSSEQSKRAHVACTIFACLALAERGARLEHEGSRSVVEALFLAINPVLIDSLEHVASTQFKDSQQNVDELIAAVADKVSLRKKSSFLLSATTQAELNSILHIGSHLELSSPVTPGNFYLWNDSGLGLGGKVEGLTWFDWSGAFNDTFSDQRATAVVPGLIEITQVCDFAQEKATVSRVVAAYLVPESQLPSVNLRTLYLWVLGPLYILDQKRNLKGNFFIVANARYFVAASIEQVARWPLFLRIRQGALTHLLSFVAAHVNRTAIMNIEP